MKTKIFLHLFLNAIALAALVNPMSAHAAPGDLYVATGTTIYKFTPAGVKSTFASGLFQAVALAFDRQGNLFVGDSGSCLCIPEDECDPCPPGTIYRFTPSGEKTTFATLASSQLLGLAFDSSGNLFVSDGLAITKITPSGTQSTFAYPVDGVWPLAFDAAGNLYAGVNPIGPSAILKFAPDGSRSTFTSLSGSSGTETLAFDAGGNLFAGDGFSIQKITPAGGQSTFASLNPDFPIALAFDQKGDLFVALDGFGPSEPAIVKFTPAGARTTFAFGPLLPSALAFEPVTEKLRNISARGLVHTGENVLIGGFIVGGNALANNGVVVRAIGPSLSTFEVANPLQNPVLELHNASGAIIASNDNWQETQAAQIKASGLAPSDDRESAIFATLPAGAYTAIVRGVNNAIGVALVEVYSLNK
jgi:sugar lactone lactonase YvrE